MYKYGLLKPGTCPLFPSFGEAILLVVKWAEEEIKGAGDEAGQRWECICQQCCSSLKEQLAA